METVRIIAVGDVVGEPGLLVLERKLPAIIRKYSVDFTVVNGENSANGFGMTSETLNRIKKSGADAVTSGNHIWEKREFWQILETDKTVLRPANYPSGAPGRGWAQFDKVLFAGNKTISFFVINLEGREFMSSINCPFRSFDSFESELSGVSGIARSAAETKPVVIVDFHAESNKEKEAFFHYLDGRAALIAGTHTHVQTADERILSKGSACITDIGMTGITGGVLGMDPKVCIDRQKKQVLYRMETAKAEKNTEAALQGIFAEIDTETGMAVSIKRINEISNC